jgi:protein subunit release factor A
LSADSQKLNDKVHKIRNEFTSTQDNEHRRYLQKQVGNLEQSVKELEEHLKDLMVPEFVEQRKLR